jgi:hypothetical protein
MQFENSKISALETELEQIRLKVSGIKLEAVLDSMLAIYEGSADWNRGYKAGAADMIIRIQKELFPSLNLDCVKNGEVIKP